MYRLNLKPLLLTIAKYLSNEHHDHVDSSLPGKTVSSPHNLALIPRFGGERVDLDDGALSPLLARLMGGGGPFYEHKARLRLVARKLY